MSGNAGGAKGPKASIRDIPAVTKQEAAKCHAIRLAKKP